MKKNELLIYEGENELIYTKKMLLLIASVLSYMEEEEFIVTKKYVTEVEHYPSRKRPYYDWNGKRYMDTFFFHYYVYSINRGEKEITRIYFRDRDNEDIPPEKIGETTDSERFFSIIYDIVTEYPYLLAIFQYGLACDPKDFTINKIIDYIIPVLDNHKKAINPKIRKREKTAPTLNTIYQNATYKDLSMN